MSDRKHLYKAACDAIDAAAADLHQLSDVIWRNPELNFQEHQAHKNLTEFLETKGFDVQRGYKTPTAYRSDYGQGKTSVAILSEYDALPEIGHACGHNLIAEAGVAAALGVKAALDKAGLDMGRLVHLGTPAEEGGGGKMVLIDAGAFKDVDCALMTHPSPNTVTRPGILANNRVKVTFHGKASHASGFPWEGVNALDAAVLAYNNISCMRQQIKPTWRVHGIITNGGTKPNIIPEQSELLYYLRVPTKREANVLITKFEACVQAAATATGCTVSINKSKESYDDMVHNDSLCKTYESHLAFLGVNYIEETPLSFGSTDMGNVSYIVPSIHPTFHIGTKAPIHTRDFTAIAGDPQAQVATLNQGKAMAMTAIDVMCDPDLLKAIKQDFHKDMQERL